MAYYDFRCKKCDKVLSVERDMDDRNTPPKSCPACRGRKFVRVYTPLNFRFQGGING